MRSLMIEQDAIEGTIDTVITPGVHNDVVCILETSMSTQTE